MSQKFTKLTAILLATVMIFALIALSACLPENPEKDHTHTFEEGWTHDAANHWHKATCGHDSERSDVAAHTYDANGKCTVCDYQKDITQDHTHTFEEGWTYDEYNHWHKATCEHDTVKSGIAAHIYGDDGKCTVCDYQKPTVTPTQITQDGWEKAFDKFVELNNFSMDAFIYGRRIYRQLNGNVALDCACDFLDNGDLEQVELYRAKIYPDGTGLEVVETYYTDSGYHYRVSDSVETVERVKLVYTEMGISDTMRNGYSLAKWNEESKTYTLSVVNEDPDSSINSINFEFTFVDDDIYEIKIVLNDTYGEGTFRIYDIGNTDVYFPWDHTHELADYYESDGMYHWHPVICPSHPDQYYNKTAHTFGDNGKCTVCGYDRTTAVTHTVTEKQWINAFLLNGVDNYVLESYDGSIITESFSAKGYYCDYGDNEVEWLYFDGADYYKMGVGKDGSSRVWTKMPLVDALDKLFLGANSTEYINVLLFRYNDFTYDEATGTYRSSYIKVNDESPLAIDVTFCDGELQKIHFYEPYYGYVYRTVTFGVAEERPRADYPLHTEADHVWEKELNEHYHTLTCTVCGEYRQGKHTYDETGHCSECGIEQNHKLEYQPFSGDYVNEKGVVECFCYEHKVTCQTCELAYTEYCDGKDGKQCAKCGKSINCDHDMQWSEDCYSDEWGHDLKCTVCGHMEYYIHSFDQDPDECSVCHFKLSSLEKHIHRSDKWYIFDNGHSGQCKDCGEWVDNRSHDFVDGVCIVCGAKTDGHVWTNVHQLIGYYEQWVDYHCGICSDCGMFSMEIEHTFGPDNRCTECGMEKHIHNVEWQSTDEYHYGVCDDCGKRMDEEHEFDENSHCDVCGFTCTHKNFEYIPLDDGQHHKIVCSVCHKELSTEEHEGHYDDISDEQHVFSCDKCNAKVTSGHNYGDDNVCTDCWHKKEEE